MDRNLLSGVLGDYSSLSQTKLNLERNRYSGQVALSNFNPTNGTSNAFGMWSVHSPGSCFPLLVSAERVAGEPWMCAQTR